MRSLKSIGLLAVGAVTVLLSLPAQADHPRCKAIHADLVEVSATTGCNAGLASCFLGEVNGNHGLRGTTHFHGDSGAAGPATGLAGFISYSGPFEYRTSRGNLQMRETGITNTSTGLPQSGAVTAYQQVMGGTGIYEGATGFLFVSGRNVGGMIETSVMGEICFSR